MLYLATLLLYLSVVCVDAILGGRNAGKYEFPYAVRISGGMLCSGSLMTLSKVLSAANCFLQFDLDGNKKWRDLNTTYIIAGTIDVTQRQGGYRTLKIKSYQVAKDARLKKSGGMYHDIAIADLEMPFKRSENIKAITIPSKERTRFKQKWDKFVESGEKCQTIGWGMTKVTEKNGKFEPSEISTVLKVVEIVPWSDEDCSKKVVPGDIDMTKQGDVCSKPAKMGESILPGDPGGPLICSGLVWGVSTAYATNGPTNNGTILFTLILNYLEELEVEEAEENTDGSTTVSVFLIHIPFMLACLCLTDYTAL